MSPPFMSAMVAALVGGFLIAQAASRHAPRPPARAPVAQSDTKSSVRVVTPAEAAEPRAPSPTGGADLRQNNPFALPSNMRQPMTTSGEAR